MRASERLAAVALVALIAGCGEVLLPETAVAIDDVPSRISAAMCERIFACCSDGEIDAVFGAGQVATEAECREAGVEILTGFYARVADAVADGAIDYDDEAAGACVVALSSLSCEQYAAAPAPQMFQFDGCATPFVARVDVGDGCETDLECTTGYCERLGADSGTCAAVPELGELCPGFRCAAGLYCDGAACVEQKDDGAPCRSFEECAGGACAGVGEDALGTCEAQVACDGA